MLSAFLEALYSVPFYKKAAAFSISKGIVYLLLWAIFAVFLAALLLVFRFFPALHEFNDWLKVSMPVITWTQQGVTMDKPSPYVLKHPKYGHVATMNLNKKEISQQDLGEALLYMTATKLYVRKQPGTPETRVYDLAGPAQVRTKDEKIVIDASFLERMEKGLKPVLLIVGAGMSFVLFFIWKLLAALFYSVLGNLINRFRREKLRYEAVLNISCFAMTASMWLSFIFLFLSDLMPFAFGFQASMLVTMLYLFLGIKLTEAPQPQNRE